MNFSMERTREILDRTPLVLTALLADLSPDWTAHPYGAGTWSPHDVVAHLIHCERADWMPRLTIILEHGAARPFDPFDRQGNIAESRSRRLGDLLAEFAALRQKNLAALDALRLTQAQLDLPGTHPKLGPVTLRNLLACWAVHDVNHIAQICKGMAYQYGDAAGRWREFLSILSPPNPR